MPQNLCTSEFVLILALLVRSQRRLRNTGRFQVPPQRAVSPVRRAGGPDELEHGRANRLHRRPSRRELDGDIGCCDRAVFASASLPAVLAYPGPAALFASASPRAVLAHLGPAAVFALASPRAVLAHLGPAALFALASPPAVLAYPAPAALFASASLPAVLALLRRCSRSLLLWRGASAVLRPRHRTAPRCVRPVASGGWLLRASFVAISQLVPSAFRSKIIGRAPALTARARPPSLRARAR